MSTQHLNSFDARARLAVGGTSVDYFALAALARAKIADIDRLPFSIRILLENLLRHEDGRLVRAEDVRAAGGVESPRRRRFARCRTCRRACCCRTSPACPAVVDLAAMREAMRRLGGDPRRINPQMPVDLVIDHSVQVDRFGGRRGVRRQRRARVRAQPRALRLSALGTGQLPELPRRAAGDRHLPPGQPRVPGAGGVQRERGRHAPGLPRHLRRHRFAHHHDQRPRRDRLGRRRHRGRGGDARPAVLHADAAGGRREAHRRAARRARPRPISCSPSRSCCASTAWWTSSSSSTARPSTRLSLADRATIANMSPEYGATMGFFPVDAQTLAYLRLSGRTPEHVALVEAYCKEQGLFRTATTPDPPFSEQVEPRPVDASSRASPGRSARRTACRCRRCRRASARR